MWCTVGGAWGGHVFFTAALRATRRRLATSSFSPRQLASQAHLRRLHSDYFAARFCQKYWLFGSLSIAVVLAILGFTYYGFVAQACLAVLWPSIGPAPTVFALVVYHLLLLMSLASYLVCVFSDPGMLPQRAAPLLLARGVPRCARCHQPKPPRAHHCSVCDRCVTKMDHHCPWVNNCVGAGNYKSFLLFVAYTGLLSLWGVLFLIPAMINLDWQDIQFPQIVMLITFGVGCIFGLMLTGFSVAHLGMLFRGVTTLETLYPTDEEALSNTRTRRQNIEEVFGPVPWLWVIPIQNQKDEF